MKFGEKLSAKQMAAVSGLGGLIAASGFLLPSARHMSPPKAYYPIWLWTVLMFGFLLVGFGISLLAESKLKEGIGNERWSQDEVVSLRAVLESPWWGGLAIACLAASCVIFAAFYAHRNVGYALMLAGQSISRLGIALRRPRDVQPGGTVWQSLSPIRSEHWGER
jgi:hypothetical protein